MNGLYEPFKEKERVREIRERRKAVRHEKARRKLAEKEKYEKLYREELAKQKAKLKAEREHAIKEFKTARAIEKAKRHARTRVRPFAPRKGLKVPSYEIDKEKVKKIKKGVKKGTKLAVKYGKIGLATLGKMYDEPKTRKRKTVKRKPVRRKAKPKTRTYYCRKCRKRHSYTSKIGKMHRR